MKQYRNPFLISLLFLLSFTRGAALFSEEPAEKSFNKLREMFHFYYLPFDVEFQQGENVNELFPMAQNRFGEFSELISPNDIKGIDTEWGPIRQEWKKKSLLLSTPVNMNEAVRISQHIISHRIPLQRSAMDNLKLTERFQLTEALKGKSPEVQANVIQLRYLKSFLGPGDEEKFNFFIFSPSWCESSKEYRSLFEGYFKNYPDPNLNLQSVVIEDPKEEVFDSKVFKELFPHNKKYSHELVPRFLAIEVVDGKSVVYEEGAALSELFNRYFKPHRGFLNSKVSFFKNRNPGTPKSASLNPKLGSDLLGN